MPWRTAVIRAGIEAILKELDIQDFTIQEDGTVDVASSVDISFLNLDKIPLSFGRIRGDFNCSNNKLTSLVGAPHSVGISFFCHNNLLTTLEHAPPQVGKSFICKGNRLISLVGAPDTINGSFDCSENRLGSLTSGPVTVNGTYDCSHNRLPDLEGLPRFMQGAFYCLGNPLDRDTLARYRQSSSLIIIGDEQD
jgi:hypothetical protein